MCSTTDAVAEALRRIDKLEAVFRRISRSLRRCVPGSPLSQDLSRQRAEVGEQLEHWRGVVLQAEAEGVKVWSRRDFVRGDFVRYRGVWYEVLRVNAKSVTVPHTRYAAGRDVVRAGDVDPGWTWTVGYHSGITGRKSASDMGELLNIQRPKDHEA